MGGTPENLAAMNLKIKSINDESIGYAGWTRKQEIHVLAKANNYQTNKPMDDGEWWGFRAPTTANSHAQNSEVDKIVCKAKLVTSGSHVH